MISGSIKIRGAKLRALSAPAPASAQPVHEQADPAFVGSFFDWATPGGDLGSHNVGDHLATTLSATFKGEKVSDYAISAGQLPPDIALNATSGRLNGELQLAGNYVFTIRAKVDTAASDCTYKITVTA